MRRRSDDWQYRVHDHYLDELVKNLGDVGEEPRGIEWIMKDGIWIPGSTTARHTLCDLICVYYGGTASALELKGSHHKRRKAVIQLHAGKDFIENVLNMEVRCMKVVYYTNKGYEHDIVY